MRCFGASRIARRAAIVINYASDNEAAEGAASLVESEGSEAIIVQADVGDDDDFRRIVYQAEKFSRIDVLFNNAGVTKSAPNHGDFEAVKR